MNNYQQNNSPKLYKRILFYSKCNIPVIKTCKQSIREGMLYFLYKLPAIGPFFTAKTYKEGIREAAECLLGLTLSTELMLMLKDEQREASTTDRLQIMSVMAASIFVTKVSVDLLYNGSGILYQYSMEKFRQCATQQNSIQRETALHEMELQTLNSSNVPVANLPRFMNVSPLKSFNSA